jgi:UDP-N-acetylglucosamine 2-epimerase
VHPNPNVRRAIEPLRQCRNIRLVEPVDYPELVFLLKRCHFVVTDSGGIQEEAPSFGKPVLVTRCNTERPEAMELGLAKLVGNDERLLYDEMRALLDEPGIYAQMSQVENPYGDGRASRRIAARLSMETTPQRALSNPFNPDRHRAIARVES